MTYVAHSTLFDGLLSTDSKMLDIYAHAGVLLDEVFII